MSTIESSPSFYRARYQLEEDGVMMTANPLMSINLELDQRIQDLGEQYHDTEKRQSTDYLIAQLAHENTRIAVDPRQPKTGTWNDYYRLLTRQSFLEQSIKAPALFQSSIDHEARAELTNGTYGMTAEIVADALEKYDELSYRKGDESALRGVICEQTTMALINYKQSPTYMALPARTIDDVHYKTDIDYWSASVEQPTHVAIQVKAQRRLPLRTIIPQRGIMIFAQDLKYDPADPTETALDTARLIVDEIYGNLDDAGQKRLHTIQANLMDTVNRRIENAFQPSEQ